MVNQINNMSTSLYHIPNDEDIQLFVMQNIFSIQTILNEKCQFTTQPKYSFERPTNTKNKVELAVKI